MPFGTFPSYFTSEKQACLQYIGLARALTCFLIVFVVLFLEKQKAIMFEEMSSELVFLKSPTLTHVSLLKI